MRRLSSLEKERIHNLVERGWSLNQIYLHCAIPKTTVYHHFRKYKGASYKQKAIPFRYDRTSGEIVGIFAGDGSQYFDKKRYHYEVNVHFGQESKNYAEYVQNIFTSVFETQFPLRKEKPHSIRLRATSKLVYEYFHHYLSYISQHKHDTVQLKNTTFPRLFLLGFLKGFLDTDGCVYWDKNAKTVGVVYMTTSCKLAYQLQEIMKDVLINTSVYTIKRDKWKDIYRVQVWKRGVKRFLDIVQPYKTRRVEKFLRR